ncbi:MAG TPA: TnsD family Tn7-like transposition protein [Pyrinomonadaceae bacterium]|nr:TnsD family Tn7-like transposition protein [Pyrinomonadaceae bacterium]
MDTFQQGLMFISQSAEWLLNQPSLVPGYDTLHGHYMSELTAAGLAYQGKFVHSSRLAEAIRHVYPDSLLAAIQCDFDEDKEYSWPFRLIKELKLRKANHPLRHLLLIGLLGHTTKSFFRIQDASDGKGDLIVPMLASTYKPSQHRNVRKAVLDQNSSTNTAANISRKPEAAQLSKRLFGTGPWPCLNVTCHLYRQPVIKNCHVAKHWEKRTFDVGVFSCVCGFTYRRNGRDKSSADQFRFDSVKEYGGIWKERFCSLWGDLTLSIHKMGHLLGVAHNTVKLQAVLLGLEFPRKGPGSKIAQAEIGREWRNPPRKRIKRSPAAKPTPRDRYRRELLRVIKKNPSATRSRLDKHLASQPYRWLYKHDREWLEAHQPPPFKRTESSRKVDWATRDAQLAKEVRLAAKQIRSTEGRPVRMTVSVIGRHLDKYALLTHKKLTGKMPLTVQALSELVETYMVFTIRSIRWAARCYLREGTIPTLTALSRRAGMTTTTTHKPEIRAVINEELESLRNTSDVSGIKAA